MIRQDLNKILSDLRILKRNSELGNNEKLTNQRDKWKSTLDHGLLKACVKHSNEKVRLEALALIIESKKSTLSFTNAELNIILLFLKYNLGEKMEYVPLIKKALKRVKGSLNVMRRNLSQEKAARERKKYVCMTSKDYIEALTKSYNISIEINAEQEVYKTFFINLRDLCISNLYPDATYCRRKLSLQILCLMQDFLDNEFKDITWNSKQAENVFTCLLLDTYESNKEMALEILKSLDINVLNLNVELRLVELLDVAINLANSIRPIDSVTAAYIFKICTLSPILQDVLCKYYNVGEFSNKISESRMLTLILFIIKQLENSLVSAKLNIVLTVTEHSLYGYLFCLRSLLSDCNLSHAGAEKSWQETIAKLISMCFELNQAVSVIVNNSSPEGHLPMDLSSQNINVFLASPEKEIVTPQMVLLCSWRTVKEVSLLFGLLATRSPISNSNSSVELLSESQIIEIGEHLVTLLCETKHRGAFEQAYVGFNQLCIRLWNVENTNLRQLPKVWLHQILLAITGLLPSSFKLCATRRSAGVPFLVQALVSSEPCIQKNLEESALRSVMKILLGFTELQDHANVWQDIKHSLYDDTIFFNFRDLIEISRADINGYSSTESKIQATEIKTHALNILRALFKNSTLGDFIKVYVADGLIAAFRNYDAKTWAERNAATLLYSALIVRIFGVQRTKDHINLTTDNRMTGKIFFEKYPSLLPFMLDELQTFVSVNDSLIKPNIQSILLLLSRLYFSYNFDGTDGKWKIDEFVNLVSQCAKSPVCKTRELAARALVPLLTITSANNIIRKLMRIIASGQNGYPSLNAMHGYMLQILEILRRLEPVRCETNLLTTFFDDTNWILTNLETSNEGPACYPLATIYLKIIYELFKTDAKRIESFDFQPIFCTLKRHVTEDNALKQGPSREIYKAFVIKLIVSVEKDSLLREKVYPVSNISSRILLHVLGVREPEMQVAAWSAMIEVVSETSCLREKKLLNSRAIDIIRGSTSFLRQCNPAVQDVIFDFLYASLTYMKELSGMDERYDKREICDMVLKETWTCEQKYIYRERNSYLRLLGKSYSVLYRELKDEAITAECVEDIYKTFCDNSWISTLNATVRKTVFDVTYELLRVDTILYVPTLEWWTMLLRLLTDENVDIRREASKLVCRIEPCNDLECIAATLETFFDKFDKIVAKEHPGVAAVALFYWGMELFENADYEMDETDVFNKCRNYDCFEPLQMSELCVRHLESITNRFSVDEALPTDVIRWISCASNLDFAESTNLRDLITSYKVRVPNIDGNLRDILNPTYKDKLLQILSYEKYIGKVLPT